MQIRNDIPVDMRGNAARLPSSAFGGLETTAVAALESIKIIDSNAIIAGGACRNAFLGIPINDIDIYMHVPVTQTMESMIHRLTGLGFTGVVRAEQAEDSPYASMPHIIGVFKCFFNAFPVDIIVMDIPTFTSVIPNFCVNVSKCWSNGYNITATQEALHDMVNDVITIPEGMVAPARYISKLTAQLETDFIINNGEIQEFPRRVPVPPMDAATLDLFSDWQSFSIQPMEPTSNRYYEEMDEYMELEEELTDAE